MFTNDDFPCLVKNGLKIEDPNVKDENEKYRRLARNGLRHLTYGVPLGQCKIVNWTTFRGLFIQKDSHLLDALREEMQNIFYKAFEYAKNKQFDKPSEERLEIFITNLLAAYPFLDPTEGGKLRVPQKINGEWRLIEYDVNRIDISPQKGLLSKLIEDQDRLYSFGLSPPINSNILPILLLMGSAYPACRGSELNWLFNFKPHNSVGEGHDVTRLAEWLAKQNKKVRLIGHSKGGTLAMILAARYPNKISEVNALNPTALNHMTMSRTYLDKRTLVKGLIKTVERLEERWKMIPPELRPRINIFKQKGDPVFLIDDRLLEGSIIYNIKDNLHSITWLAAHAHYVAGRKSVTIEKIDDANQQIKNYSRWRDYITHNRQVMNRLMFPLLYSIFSAKFGLRKITTLIKEHLGSPKSLLLICAASVLATISTFGTALPVLFCLGAGLYAGYLTYKKLEPSARLAKDLTFAMVLLATIAASLITAAALYVLKHGANKLLSKELDWLNKLSNIINQSSESQLKQENDNDTAKLPQATKHSTTFRTMRTIRHAQNPTSFFMEQKDEQTVQLHLQTEVKNKEAANATIIEKIEGENVSSKCEVNCSP